MVACFIMLLLFFFSFLLCWKNLVMPADSKFLNHRHPNGTDFILSIILLGQNVKGHEPHSFDPKIAQMPTHSSFNFLLLCMAPDVQHSTLFRKIFLEKILIKFKKQQINLNFHESFNMNKKVNAINCFYL